MRAVFLDRDGVLNFCRVVNGKPYPPKDIETFKLIPDAVDACKRLSAAGYKLIVVTNQPDVGRGNQTIEVLESMHQVIRTRLNVDAIYFCTHGSDNECDCRKPKPGMLVQASKDLEIDLGRSFMVGDRWRDVDCGFAAGCQTIFIDYQYDEQLRCQPDVIVAGVGQAADWILSQSS